MIIKVCGIREEENIKELSNLNLDMVGLNFYKPSIRYISDQISPEIFDTLDSSISRVGVFVNMDIDDIMDKVDEYRLDYAQLHGDEDLQFVKELQKKIPVIKVFRVGDNFNMKSLLPFAFVDFVLFDKDSKAYGGSGNKFDWSILDEYPLEVPFLLSGGIGPNDVEKIQSIDHQLFKGVDINSKFEKAPAYKDVALIQKFVRALK